MPNRTQALLVAALLLVPTLALARCDLRLPIHHAAHAGAFDFSYSAFEGVTGLCRGTWPVQLRFWEHGNYAARYDVFRAPRELCFEPWLNRAPDLATPGAYSNQWCAVHEDWFGEGATECPSRSWTTVIETSFFDTAREGTADHRGLYAVAVVGNGCLTPIGYDLDQVRGGVGPEENIVVVQEIPPLLQVSRGVFDGTYHHLFVQLDGAPSHGTPGHLPASSAMLFAIKSRSPIRLRVSCRCGRK